MPDKFSHLCAKRVAARANMSDECTVLFSRKLVKQFILKYKELVCLWHKHAPNYKSKKDRIDAITQLTRLVQSYDPAATRVHVLRKIDSLRACVRREYRRVTDSRKEARNESEVYVPQLWYYSLFSFVLDLEEVKDVESPSSSPEPQAVESSEEEALDSEGPTSDEIKTEPPCEAERFEYIQPSTSSNFIEEPRKKIKRGPDTATVGDEYDAIGINVAAKLRNLPDNMRILAEKLIGDVLFQAQTNGLTSSTALVTPDPFR